MGNRRKVRAATAVAGLALAAMMLSGCSLIDDGGTVIGFLSEDAANDERMRALVDDLAALPGVSAADGSFDPTADEPGPWVTVQVTEKSTPEEVAGVVARVADDYASEWSVFVSRLVISAAPGSQLSVTDFSRSEPEVAAEVTYWRAVEDAVDSPLHFALDPASPTLPGSMITAPPSNVDAVGALLANWDAVLAIEPSPTGAWPFFLNGFTSVGELPPARYVEAARQVADIASDSAVSAQGVVGSVFQWADRDGSDSGAVYSIATPGLEFSRDGTGSADWERVTAAADVFAGAGLEQVTFTFLQGEEPVSFHIGECADEPASGTQPDAASADLLPALEAAGVSLPANAAPGYCQHWSAL